jgi:hypothetical protein
MMSTAHRRILCLFIVCSALLLPSRPASAGSLSSVRTVFIIVMENHDWSTIHTGPDSLIACPYINNTLMPMASYATQYFNPAGLHPSSPNYLWLEGGASFGVVDDSRDTRIDSAAHLVTQLNNAGISWTSYQEDITGTDCPLTDRLEYVVHHNPMVLFNDVSGDAAYCTRHVRPYAELAHDLTNNTVARYNFITPNLFHDMHSVAPGSLSRRLQGDAWLSHEVPKILASQAYRDKGALFITWDEGDNSVSDGPIGMIVLSPLAKGHGYYNAVHYTHSSTLRTMQDIFGVRPYLGDAANAVNLSNLFVNPTIALPLLLAKGQIRTGSH